MKMVVERVLYALIFVCMGIGLVAAFASICTMAIVSTGFDQHVGLWVKYWLWGCFGVTAASSACAWALVAVLRWYTKPVPALATGTQLADAE